MKKKGIYVEVYHKKNPRILYLLFSILYVLIGQSSAKIMGIIYGTVLWARRPHHSIETCIYLNGIWLTFSATQLCEIVRPVRLSLDPASSSVIHSSTCTMISFLFSQKCRSMTSLKQAEGFLSCSSIAHLTVAWRMFASYSLELAVPDAVPRDLSYPGSLKYGSDTRIRDWIETNTWSGKWTLTFSFQLSLCHNWHNKISLKIHSIDCARRTTWRSCLHEIIYSHNTHLMKKPAWSKQL